MSDNNQAQGIGLGPVGTAAVGAGSGALGSIIDLAFSGMRQKQQLKGQKIALQQQNEAAYDMWLKTNYKAQVGQPKEAGLNPGLLYGMGGGGGGTTGGASAMPSASSGHGMDIAGAMQLALMKAQKENIEADTANKRSGAGESAARTPGAQADSTMKTQEAESRRGWTSVMSKTFGDEQEARQAIASTIGEMWKEGKLKEGADADLQEKLLKNAKTEQEKEAIKLGMEKMRIDMRTGELNNEILELEKEMQTELGIDRGSPTWLKMIGRIFMRYFKK